MPKSYQTLRLFIYKVNRPLSEDEIRDHLPQKERSRSTPWFQLSVIRMNSTFLECVDKIHGMRGAMAAMVIAAAPMILSSIIIVPFLVLRDYSTLSPEKQTEALLALGAVFLMLLPLLALYIFAMRADCFRYTHYPTRFNRKTRMVHAFRPNGTVLSVPWDEVYFTLNYCGGGYWEVVGHLLSEDGKTVLDTFPLSTRAPRKDNSSTSTLYQHWEFVRQYMEDGPYEAYDQISTVFPIDKKKETFAMGLERLFANLSPFPLMQIIFSPAFFAGAIGRWVAMRTCKIPRWPDEVEAECVIEPDDPYIRDEHHLAYELGREPMRYG